MKLSRTVAYAIQATLQLAQGSAHAPVPCSQLAADGHMPERFLLQILRSLVLHGILRSTRGVDGGYVLTRGPEEISILDLIEAIDGPLETAMPEATNGARTYENKLRGALDQVTANVRQQLSGIKLANLMQPAHAGK